MTKQKRYILKHQALGLCIRCSNKAIAHDLCRVCYVKYIQGRKSSVEANLIIRKYRRENNLCLRCGAVLRPDSDSATCCINCNEHEIRPAKRLYRRRINIENIINSQHA